MGFFRQEPPIGHPEFGRPIPCRNPAHADERISRLAGLSIDMDQFDQALRPSDIAEMSENTEMLKAGKNLMEKGYGWLYIFGGPGNAKTVLGKALVNEVNRKGQGPAMYVKFSTMLSWIKAAFARDARESYSDRFKSLTKVRMLVIDEFDKVNTTNFVEEFRFDFLDERYEKAVKRLGATVFIANSPATNYPEPIQSRLSDGRFKIVENRAGDARPGMGWD